jgi:Na+/melibiose symporter-like transporter
VHLLVWYQVFGFLGGAAGNFASGMFISGLESKGYTSLETYRFLFLFIYVAGATFNIVLAMCMTTYTEVDHPPLPGTTLAAIAGDNDSEATPLLPANPAPPAKLPYVRLAALCLLFSFDSFASSLIPTSFISYYFRQRFNAPITTITRMFGTSAIIAGVSQLAAGSIAKRLSLVLTMVCTHMPAQLLTISLAFAPTLQVAVSIFLVRAMIASMDSAVRGAFLAAIVPKASRTRFLGSQSRSSPPHPALND